MATHRPPRRSAAGMSILAAYNSDRICVPGTPLVLHHWYRSAGDLLPSCGVYPGSDPCRPLVHAGHTAAELLAYHGAQAACCATCINDLMAELDEKESINAHTA